jgi:hypothetical protein
MDSKIEPAVFVIESPGPRDVLDGRVEGEALSAALRLADITSSYYRVENLEMLRECFSRIIIATRTQTRFLPGQTPQQTLFVPHFHFSAHGNENGLGLTSGEFIGWEILRTLLIEYACATGRVSDKGACLFPIALSTCKGAHAGKMFASGAPQPCIAVVGPTESVAWSDSLTAYVVFYHLHITKGMQAQQAVAMMNQAAGLQDVFKCHLYNRTGSAEPGATGDGGGM